MLQKCQGNTFQDFKGYTYQDFHGNTFQDFQEVYINIFTDCVGNVVCSSWEGC